MSKISGKITGSTGTGGNTGATGFDVNDYTANDIIRGNIIRYVGDSLVEGSYNGPIGFGNLGSHASQIFSTMWRNDIVQNAVSGSTSTNVLNLINSSSAYELALPHIICVGTNDLDDTGAANNATQVALLKSNIAAIVAKLATVGNDKYLIIGVPNTQTETTASVQVNAEAYAAKLQYNTDMAALYGIHFFDTPAYFRSVAPAANGSYSATLTTDGKHRTILGIQTEAAGILAHFTANPDCLFSRVKASPYEKIRTLLRLSEDYPNSIVFVKNGTLTLATNLTWNGEQGTLRIGGGNGNKDAPVTVDGTARVGGKVSIFLNTNNIVDQNTHGVVIQFSGSNYDGKGVSLLVSNQVAAQFGLRATALGTIPALSAGHLVTTGASYYIGAPAVNITSTDGTVSYARYSAKGVEHLTLTTAARQALTSVPAGAMVFDSNLKKYVFYTGTAWEIITSVGE